MRLTLFRIGWASLILAAAIPAWSSGSRASRWITLIATPLLIWHGWIRLRDDRLQLRPRNPQLLKLRPRCPTCNYDLRATPNRCPECGEIPVKPPGNPTAI